MTAVIRDLLPKHARYLGIEINPAFHTILQQRFPKLDFHLGSAADIQSILQQRHLPLPARIVSGLPFASLPAKVQDAVITGIVHSLRGTDAEERGLPQASDAEVLAAMAAEPKLIERPLVETDKGVRLCRPQDKVLEIL